MARLAAATLATVLGGVDRAPPLARAMGGEGEALDGLALAKAVFQEYNVQGNVEPHDFGPPTGRGLRCKRDLREGEVLVEVPFEWVVTTERAKAAVLKAFNVDSVGEVEQAVPEELSALTGQDYLCLWLLLERARGPASPHATWLASIPPERGDMSAAFWPEEALAELAGCDALVRLEALREAIGEAHARVAQVLSGLDASTAAPFEGVFSEVAYSWARCVLNSRQFGASWADSKEIGALVPGADFLNHNCRLLGKITYRRDTEKGTVQVLAACDFAEGEEAMVSYGRLGNAQQLGARGFAAADNPEDSAELVMTVRCNELRMPVLLAAGEMDLLGWEDDFEWNTRPGPDVTEAEARIVLRKSRPLPESLLALSRAESLSDATLAEGPVAGPPEAPCGVTCERAVLTQLLHIVRAMLSRYSTTDAEDELALRSLREGGEDGASSAQREMAVMTRMGEKAVFRATARAVVAKLVVCLGLVEGRTQEAVGGSIWWNYLQSKKEELEAGHNRIVGLFQLLQGLLTGSEAETTAQHVENCLSFFLWLHGLGPRPRRGAAGEGLADWAAEASGEAEDYLSLYFGKLAMWGRYLLSQFATSGAFSLSDMNTMQMEAVGLRNAFSWSAPTSGALAALGRRAPLLEVGGGNGLWARLLLDRGVDVICFDTAVGDDGFGGHVEQGTALMGTRCSCVQEGGPEQVPLHPDRTLVLMWPDYQGEGSFSLECLRRYEGQYLVLVGEWRDRTLGLVHAWGQSFSEDFQKQVEASFELAERCALPCWPLFCDGLSVWRRREGAA